MWMAGLAAGGAAVAAWRVVGSGYTWLVAGVVVGFGVLAAALGGGPAAVAGVVLALAAGLTTRVPPAPAWLFAAAAVAFLVAAWSDAGVALIAAGAVLLGAVSSEMLLGHWFLVDPRLPRWSLFGLAFAAGAGLVLEVLVVAGKGGFSSDDAFLVAAFVALAVLTALLIAGVWFSLREPRYSGVMAATGLSYLAVLTAFGVVVVGGALVDAGSVPLS